MSNADVLTPEETAIIRQIARSIRITKITATRAVKSRGGDSYIGFGAAWQSTQDDGARDLDEDQPQGWTLKEAKIASILLGMEADLAAFQNARAGGTLSVEATADSIKTCKQNYMHQLAQSLRSSKNKKMEGP